MKSRTLFIESKMDSEVSDALYEILCIKAEKRAKIIEGR